MTVRSKQYLSLLRITQHNLLLHCGVSGSHRDASTNLLCMENQGLE